ncbi:MAG: diguanylate cyclase [Rhodoferax sp.]|nr:diguanylate cyclase [Rhodoferax sp.]
MKNTGQRLPGASSFWLVALVLLAVLAASLINAWNQYNNALEQEFRLLEVRARQREASILGALESVNLMLSNIIVDFKEKPSRTTTDKTRLLKDALRQLPQLRSLVITDASGHITASNNEQLIGFDASKREYYSVHRDAPLNQAFHISAPFKTVTGVFATTLSRALVDQNQRFAGVAVATFEGSFFNRALQFSEPATGTQALLVHQGGVILSAVPQTQLAGQSLAGGPSFGAHQTGAQASSRHVNVTKLERVKRLVVIQNTDATPLRVIVTRDFDTALAEFRQAMLIHVSGFVSLVSVTLLATGLAWRRQRALAERESFIRTVTDAMPGMVGYWDQDLRCQFANKAYLEWFGKPPEAIIGHTALSLFGAALLEKNGPLMHLALQGTPQHFERTLTKADGSVGYTWAHYIPDLRAGGSVAGFFVLVTDVTPLKLAQIKLKDSEAFTRSVLDSLTEHVAVLDADGVITAVNAAWQKFAADNGATDTAKVSVGANYLEICANAASAPNGEEAAQALAGIRSVLDGSLPDFTLEYPCHSPAEQCWFVLHGLPLRGANPGAVLIHQNVTSRHQAEALLRASEEHFRMLAENMADMVWKADSQMRFTYINAADRRLRGFEREEVIGTPIVDALTAPGQEILARLVAQRRSLEASGNKGVVLNLEIPMRHKHGGEVWIELSTMPTYDSTGKIQSFQGVGRDISERKQRESQWAESQHNLQNQLLQVAQQKDVLQEQALHDPLTGICNRRYLDETLPRELSRAKRDAAAVAVIMLDLDHFKRVNDEFSHAAGDEVLKALAKLLKNGTRESDMICRYGGEEFVVIMPNMSANLALERVESWRSELQGTTVRYGDFTIQVTLSAGIADYPAHGDTPEMLLSRADEALYRSKHQGRNRISVYQA